MIKSSISFMKINLGLISLVFSLGLNVNANEPVTSAGVSPDEQVEKPIGAIVESQGGLPCLKLSVACKKFLKDSKSDKKPASTQQCVDDLVAGKKIEGLQIDPATVDECKKVRGQLRQK